MPKITLSFDSPWAQKEYEAEGDYEIYRLIEELLHRLCDVKCGTVGRFSSTVSMADEL